jgi:hypothetical protein
MLVLVQLEGRNSKLRNCSRSDAQRIALASLRNLYDLLRDDFCYRIGAVGEAKDTQRTLVGHRDPFNFIWPERTILQQAIDCHGTNTQR